MPIMEVVLTQDYQGQECINRWNYLATGTPAAVSFSLAMAQALGAIEEAGIYPPTLLMRQLSGLQVAGTQFVELSVRDVFSPTDFYTVPFLVPLGGVQGGTAMSPAFAYGFRTNRTRLDVRRATKRLVGVSESQIAPGGAIEPTFLTSGMANVAGAMNAVLTYIDEGNTLTFTPIVAAKEKYQSNTNPVRFAYRYYASEALQLQHIMSSIIWSAYDTVRTQVSRQYGRGR